MIWSGRSPYLEAQLELVAESVPQTSSVFNAFTEENVKEELGVICKERAIY